MLGSGAICRVLIPPRHSFSLLDAVTVILDFQLSLGIAYGANAGKVDLFVPPRHRSDHGRKRQGCLLHDAIQANAPSVMAKGSVEFEVVSLVTYVLNQIDPYFEQFNCSTYNTSLATAIQAFSGHFVPSDG